jgi:hypothetical protein
VGKLFYIYIHILKARRKGCDEIFTKVRRDYIKWPESEGAVLTSHGQQGAHRPIAVSPLCS